MRPLILVINSGSSSVKFSVFEKLHGGTLVCLGDGAVKGLDGKSSMHVRSFPGGKTAQLGEVQSRTHDTAVTAIRDWVSSEFPDSQWLAVGHRVVHGGKKFIEPVMVDAAALNEFRGLIPLDPLHQPICVAGIEKCQSAFPGVPQIACFDTAFHATQPNTATAVALPEALTRNEIRRYGFHGLSYQYIAYEIRTIDPKVAAGRVIVAHLGNGASLCALRDGKSIATTMGFSVLDGLVMGTRCGTLDPGIVLYLLNTRGIDSEALEDILYRKSGLLGVSGISGDVRDLLASSDPKAKEALELYVYRIVRETGSLVAALGGLDGIIFTGGVGEHSDEIRKRVLSELGWLGLAVDNASNQAHAQRISSGGSKIPAYVIPTDENRIIAMQVAALVR